jgi:large conductance mechanosensitive channel
MMTDFDLQRVTAVARRVEERTNKIISEFRGFVLKQNMISLIIAFILGGATNTLVQQASKSVIIPLVNWFIRDQSWRELKFLLNYYKDVEGNRIGNFLSLGDLLWALLNFVIVGVIAFILSKIMMRPAPAAPVVPTRVCPSCLESVLLDAKACKFCTRDLPPIPPTPDVESP